MSFKKYFIIYLLTVTFVQNNSLKLLSCPTVEHDLDVVSSQGLDIASDDTNTQDSYALTKFDKWIYKLVIREKKSISNIIFALRHLTRLEITGVCFEPCSHESIPFEIQCFASSLTQLTIESTHIPHLPDYIGNLTKLTSLKLANTGLINLPTTIGNLINLETLDLSNNYLTSLPQIISKLFKLKTLDLTNNRHLHTIQAINYSPSITHLHLDNCRINQLPRNLSSLHYLRMSNNSLKDLTDITTLGVHSIDLKQFYFRQNQIRYVPLGLFRMKNLDILYLDNNLIRCLPLKALHNTTLKQLFIRRNCLTSKCLETLQIKNSKTSVTSDNQGTC